MPRDEGDEGDEGQRIWLCWVASSRLEWYDRQSCNGVDTMCPFAGQGASACALVLIIVTPLGARFFGIYTFMASIVRAYAAYNITVKQ